MSRILEFDHVGITVTDLDVATDFFVLLGFEVEGRTFIEGDFLDTVIGIPNSLTEIVMLRSAGSATGLELSCFVRPAAQTGSASPMSNELGLRNITFEVDELAELLAQLSEQGYLMIGGVGRYEDSWLMAHVRGPDGIIVSLAQRIS